MHTCKRCGYEYDAENQEPPENATIYWEPHCPVCNAKLTATEITEQILEIHFRIHDKTEFEDANEDEYTWEEWREKGHAMARYYYDK